MYTDIFLGEFAYFIKKEKTSFVPTVWQKLHLERSASHTVSYV